MVGYLITVLIFGYAGWTLYRHVKKRKEGACLGCSQNKSCSGAANCCPPQHNSKKSPI